MCRPSANTENPRRTREKPLLPRVASFKSGVKSANDLKFRDDVENWFFSAV